MKLGDVLHINTGATVKIVSIGEDMVLTCIPTADHRVAIMEPKLLKAFKKDDLMTIKEYKQYTIEQLEKKKSELDEKILKLKSEIIELDEKQEYF